jgi:hypothetical protein
MRLLPVAALVLASLVFSVGGVAIVGRADSPAQSPAQPAAQADASAAKPADPGQCAVPKPFDGHMRAVRVTPPKGTVTLNTRGYNYAFPGDLQMDPSGRTKPGDPPAATAEPAAPPAAPAQP